MELDGRLISLYKHWCVADSVSYHLRRSLSAPVDETHGMAAEFVAMSVSHSMFLTLSVYYSLLYVVVEGYRDIGLEDESINTVLSNGEYIENLRRFRNATFHFQKAPISAKMMEFLEQKDSERWIRDLDRALRGFFEKSFDLKAVITRFQEMK
jgi:hypothetical protein